MGYNHLWAPASVHGRIPDMLVLSRKVGERIIVRDTETEEVLSIMLVEIVPRDGMPAQVRLGIEASRRYNIAREEADDWSRRRKEPPAEDSSD